MKVSMILESAGGPNRFFTLIRGTDVWQGKPSGGGPVYSKVRARQGSELHWLHGGMFLIQDENVISSIHMANPNDSGEADHHAYRHNPTAFTARELNELVSNGTLEEISSYDAEKVRYAP